MTRIRSSTPPIDRGSSPRSVPVRRYAGALLEAVAAGRIPRSAIAAIDAQQIRSLNDAAITRRLGEVWGEVRDTPEAKKQLLARYKAELTPAQLAAADLSQGRAVFASTCGACHLLYGEGGKLGPDLTGGERRHDLDSLLAKIVDPSAELPVTSRYTIVKLKDGRTVGGIVDNRTATTLTLRTSADPVTVAHCGYPVHGAVERVAHAGGAFRSLHRGAAAEPRRVSDGHRAGADACAVTGSLAAAGRRASARGGESREKECLHEGDVDGQQSGQTAALARSRQGRPPPSDGLPPLPSGVVGQEIEEARFAEKFLNARGSADDPHQTVRARGQVVHLNQLAHAAGVQIRHGRQIQLYSSNASAQHSVHRPLHITAEWDAKGSTDVQNRDAR